MGKVEDYTNKIIKILYSIQAKVNNCNDNADLAILEEKNELDGIVDEIGESNVNNILCDLNFQGITDLKKINAPTFNQTRYLTLKGIDLAENLK